LDVTQNRTLAAKDLKLEYWLPGSAMTTFELPKGTSRVQLPPECMTKSVGISDNNSQTSTEKLLQAKCMRTAEQLRSATILNIFLHFLAKKSWKDRAIVSLRAHGVAD
jgi:hypothetical protein